MSDHDIGRGLNSVVKTIMELYDQNALETEVAKKLIRSCAKGVHWSDGNEYEALDYIYSCRCGKCLKMVPKGEKLYSVDMVSNQVPDMYSIEKKAGLATDRLCTECFDEVISIHCDDPQAGKREIEYIEKNEREENYISEGNYRSTNNGCRWR